MKGTHAIPVVRPRSTPRVVTPAISVLALCLSATPWAAAQESFAVDWNTVDCGGGQSNGDEFLLDATIAQYDAGMMSGPESVETFSIIGGFWITRGGGCYPNCDGSAVVPVLTSNDLLCFINAFANGHEYANCDLSIGAPVLTSNDFVCFLNHYAAGCS